jgi:hypothetical protein
VVILYSYIKGRKTALEIEQQLVTDYAMQNDGKLPRDQKRPKPKDINENKLLCI